MLYVVLLVIILLNVVAHCLSIVLMYQCTIPRTPLAVTYIVDIE